MIVLNLENYKLDDSNYNLKSISKELLHFLDMKELEDLSSYMFEFLDDYDKIVIYESTDSFLEHDSFKNISSELYDFLSENIYDIINFIDYEKFIPYVLKSKDDYYFSDSKKTILHFV